MLNVKFLAAIPLALAAVCVAPKPVSAQSEGNAEYCTNVSNSGNGTTTIQNNCAFQIHYYWIPVNDPNMHYNNYLNAGSTDTFSPNGEFRWYACDAAYYVVGPDGRVITHLVNSYSCKKK